MCSALHPHGVKQSSEIHVQNSSIARYYQLLVVLLALIFVPVRSIGTQARQRPRHRVHAGLQSALSDEWIQRNKDGFIRTKSCPCSLSSQCQTIPRPPLQTNEVFGFINGNDTSFFNWTRITTVAWANDDEVMCDAHSHGARAVLAAPSFNLTEFAINAQARHEWVFEALYMVQSRYRDGMVFDFEAPLAQQSKEAQEYVTLVQETSLRFHAANPSLQITVCVAWSPEGIDGRYYLYQELANAADALYVMDYDTQSQIYQACIAGANAPYFGMIKGIQQFISRDISPSKLILGVPWYGYRYPCLVGTPREARFCPIEPIPFRGVNCSDAVGSEVAFLSILEAFHESNARMRRDSYMDAPFFNTIEDERVTQYWFDDAQSLRNKFKWAKSIGLTGVGPYSFDDLNPKLYPTGARNYSEPIWSSFDAFCETESTTLLVANEKMRSF